MRLVPAMQSAGLEQFAAVRHHQEWPAILAKHDIDSLSLPFGGRFDVRTPYALNRAIKRFKPDVVLSWMSRATSFCSKLRNIGPGVIHCAWVGENGDLTPYRRCDHLIGGAKPVFESIIQSGWPAERAHYLPSFVNDKPADPAPRARYSTPKDTPLLLGIGPLHESKGFDVLIRSIAELPHAYAWIAGEGPLRRSLEDLAIEVGVRPRVRFLGRVDDEAALFNTADILVCPSRYEPLGTVILKSWAYRTPVIAAASDGPRALIKHDKTGALFKVDDNRDLARTLKRFFLNPGLRRDLVEHGRDAYETSYSPDVVAPQFLSFFDQVSASRHTGNLNPHKSS